MKLRSGERRTAGSHIDAVHAPWVVRGRGAGPAEALVDAVVLHEADPGVGQGPSAPGVYADASPERTGLDRTVSQGPRGGRRPEHDDRYSSQQQESDDFSLHDTSYRKIL